MAAHDNFFMFVEFDEVFYWYLLLYTGSRYGVLKKLDLTNSFFYSCATKKM